MSTQVIKHNVKSVSVSRKFFPADYNAFHLTVLTIKSDETDIEINLYSENLITFDNTEVIVCD